jgi:CheY-like chemotaxis protein
MTLSASPARVGVRQLHLCVLMVEDNEADAYLIGRALADNPMVARVVHAHDGYEALDMVDRGLVTPDLAIIDLHMPRMNGFDLMLAFSTRPQLNFPMVVLTSSSAPKDAIRSRLRSALRVVIKPDTVTELYAMIQSAIETTCHPNADGSNTRLVGPQPHPLMNRRPPTLRRQP